METLQYSKRPIGYIETLAKALSIETDELIRLAHQADSFYYLHKRIEKPDGSHRDIYGVKNVLKVIQQRIVRRIYNNVYFPQYLQGSIKDTDIPRSHISDAALHLNSRVLIRMDISNFYPSLLRGVILDIWKRFFNFPEDVALTLTQLTTYHGFLPQGAPTSPGLGNIAFWEEEPRIVYELREEGFEYSRLVDDISISTRQVVKIPELAPIFGRVLGMFRSKGVKPNRNKIDIATSGHSMIVHNLNVNGAILTITNREQSRIRAAVKECEDAARESRFELEYEALWRSVWGRVMYLNQLHPRLASGYLARLELTKPLLSEQRLTEIEIAVNECVALVSGSNEMLPKAKYRQVQKKVAILAQVYPVQMRPYLDTLRMIAP